MLMIHMDEVLTKFVTASHSKIYIFVRAVCNSNSNYCSGNQSLQQHNFKLMKYYAIAKITLLHPQYVIFRVKFGIYLYVIPIDY